MYVCAHVCAQKNERLTHLFMKIFLLVLFPDFHAVVIFFFIALSSCAEFFLFLFFMGIKVAFLIPPPHTFVTHDETNQAKCNKSSNEQIEQCVMCSKLDRSYNM